MEQKLQRRVSSYVVEYLYTTLEFVAKAKAGQTRYYIDPSPTAGGKTRIVTMSLSIFGCHKLASVIIAMAVSIP
ncbi:MAG: hypothetical protein ABSF79_12490 [Smithellaceae bacterium]|jgi:hypothetical protein